LAADALRRERRVHASGHRRRAVRVAESAHAITQALWHRKLIHIDLNGQHGPRCDQDLRFGAGNARRVLGRGRAGGGRLRRPGPLRHKPPRTEHDEGVWASAAKCMRNYLILREKVRAFRADPEVQQARVDALAVPTMAEGETWRDIAGLAVDSESLEERGMAFEHLDQLALKHLYGIR
jgi:xylose isomerase